MSHEQVSRRTVAKGAAWSLPVVAVAAAAPAASASPAACDFSVAGPQIGATNCSSTGLTVTVGDNNKPGFTVSGLPESCVGAATWSLAYNGTVGLALNNFGTDAIGVSVLGYGTTTVHGTFTATSASLPVLSSDLVNVATGVGEDVTLTVSDGAGNSVSSTMSFTVVLEATSLVLTYLTCKTA